MDGTIDSTKYCMAQHEGKEVRIASLVLVCVNQRVPTRCDTASDARLSSTNATYVLMYARTSFYDLLTSFIHPFTYNHGMHDEVPRSAPAMQSSRLQSVRTTAAKVVVDSSI